MAKAESTDRGLRCGRRDRGSRSRPSLPEVAAPEAQRGSRSRGPLAFRRTGTTLPGQDRRAAKGAEQCYLRVQIPRSCCFGTKRSLEHPARIDRGEHVAPVARHAIGVLYSDLCAHVPAPLDDGPWIRQPRVRGRGRHRLRPTSPLWRPGSANPAPLRDQGRAPGAATSSRRRPSAARPTTGAQGGSACLATRRPARQGGTRAARQITTSKPVRQGWPQAIAQRRRANEAG